MAGKGALPPFFSTLLLSLSYPPSLRELTHSLSLFLSLSHTHRYASEKVLVNDEEVMQSYLDLVCPPGLSTNAQGGRSRRDLSAKGLLLKYILYGRLLCRIEDNLFVHGGVNEYNLGWLAPVSPHRE